MKFWDSSALVPLVVAEVSSTAARELHKADPEVLVWWGSELECASAVARRERAGGLVDAETALQHLRALAGGWRAIDPAEPLKRAALRVVRAYALRTADACQLAAAIVASEGDATALPFVTLDERLADAARREGFPVLEPA